MSERLQKMYDKSKESAASPDPDESCDFSQGYPTLFAFLTSRSFSGKKRVPGTITLFWDEGKAKARLNDRELAAQAFVSGDTFQAVLETSERKIASGELEWRKQDDDSKVPSTYQPRRR